MEEQVAEHLGAGEMIRQVLERERSQARDEDEIARGEQPGRGHPTVLASAARVARTGSGVGAVGGMGEGSTVGAW